LELEVKLYQTGAGVETHSIGSATLSIGILKYFFLIPALGFRKTGRISSRIPKIELV
jgi:hypothetical protein